MKRLLLFMLLLSLFCSLLAANESIRDAFDEMETEELHLYFFNALNGEPIENAYVDLKGIGEFRTDRMGKIAFQPQEDNYSQEVSFMANKFIKTTFDVEVRAGTIFFNRYSISPVMNIEYFRVVVDWDKSPHDLDAHFVKKGQYHISYHNTRVLSDGRGQLDRDDMDGYGPETITVTSIEQNANYEFYVHDYTNRNNKNSNGLSKSKAIVKVYGNRQLLKVINVPTNKKGNTWRVFRIENGLIIVDNEIE